MVLCITVWPRWFWLDDDDSDGGSTTSLYVVAMSELWPHQRDKVIFHRNSQWQLDNKRQGEEDEETKDEAVKKLKKKLLLADIVQGLAAMSTLLSLGRASA
ncbi:hypothetical protein PV326_002095 [Microctonus aethiopoides]|nr:hypothetical protein PV326_002095 [Microctonus aethiopoides]